MNPAATLALLGVTILVIALAVVVWLAKDEPDDFGNYGEDE